MKLCFSPTSPFARKVVVVAHEKGMMDKIEMTAPDLSDLLNGLNPANPLGKIPSLELDNGDVLFDSIVISEYLDGISDGPALFPADPTERARVMTLHAIGNGMTDAAFSRRWSASVLPENEQSPTWDARLAMAMAKSVDVLEARVAELSEVNIGSIAVACGIGYMDFRFADENWREGRPNLAKWYEEFSARPSMQATTPPEV
jgi:glutathione S-transferase